MCFCPVEPSPNLLQPISRFSHDIYHALLRITPRKTSPKRAGDGNLVREGLHTFTEPRRELESKGLEKLNSRSPFNGWRWNPRFLSRFQNVWLGGRASENRLLG